MDKTGLQKASIRAGVGSFGGKHPKADYFFWWFVTRRCNNHCRHCLRLGIGDRGEELDASCSADYGTRGLDL